MERQRSLRRRKKYDVPFSKKLKECVRSFVAFMFSNVGIIGLVVGYAVAGAFIFIEIEGNALKEVKYNATKNRIETARMFWNLALTMNVFDEKTWRRNVSIELLNYQNSTVDAIRAGYYNSDISDYSKQWSISGAFLYSLTVITTIGYGNIVPRTYWGKVTTIIYAIIGMPLFLLYLSNIGDIMARSFKWLYATCCLCKGCPGVSKRRAERRRQRQEEMMEMENQMSSDTSESSWQERESSDGYSHDIEGELEESEATTEGLSEESFDTQSVTVPVTICLMIMVGYIFGGALLFASYEGWNYLDGSYFCFISLSTIGFGDIVPGDKTYSLDDIGLSFIFCAMYLMLGMALIAMCFNLMQEEVIHKFRTMVATIKYVLRCDR